MCANSIYKIICNHNKKVRFRIV